MKPRPSSMRVTPLMILAACLTTASAGAGEFGSVKGRVMDAKGPLQNAVVVVIGETTRATRTDGDGRFELARFRPGVYVLSVSKRGHQTKLWEILIREGKTRQVNIRLKALPPNTANRCDSPLFWAGAPVCDETGKIWEGTCFVPRRVRPVQNKLQLTSNNPKNCGQPDCPWAPPPDYWTPPPPEGPVQGVRQPPRISPGMASYLMKPIPVCNCSCSESYKAALKRSQSLEHP
jgi:carboxypeptidase family protein